MFKYRNPKPSNWRPLEEILVAALFILGCFAIKDTLPLVLSSTLEKAESLLKSNNPHRMDLVEMQPRLTDFDLKVLPRKSWHAKKPRNTLQDLGTPYRITIHHQGGPTFTSEDLKSTITRIRSIQESHFSERHWDDIAYHFLIDVEGRIWEGRPITMIGAHAGNQELNEGNIGIVLLGNFEIQEPTPKQQATLIELLERACEYWQISRKNVLTHKEIRREAGMGATACPGKYLEEVVKGFRGG